MWHGQKGKEKKKVMELKCEPRSPESQASVLTLDTWIFPCAMNISLTKDFQGHLITRVEGLLVPDFLLPETFSIIF